MSTSESDFEGGAQNPVFAKAAKEASGRKDGWWSKLVRRLNIFTTVFARNFFPSLAIVALSIASFFTTFQGFLNYAKFPVALFASLGVQVLLAFVAASIGLMRWFGTTRTLVLLIVYAGAMAVSSFFSFATFHRVIESEERLAEEADTFIRSEWTSVYTGVIQKVTGEFGERLARLRADGNDPYANWLEDYSQLGTEAGQIRAVVRGELDPLMAQSGTTVGARRSANDARQSIIDRAIAARIALIGEIGEIETKIVQQQGEVARL